VSKKKKGATGDVGHICRSHDFGILFVRRMWGTRGKKNTVYTVGAPTARAY
jgi:hypothetical protein